MPIIRLQSSDNEIVPVDLEVIKCSETISMALQDSGGEDNCEVLPLPKVNAVILKKVITWATHHKDDPVVADEDEAKKKRSYVIPDWDVNFLKVNEETLFELMLAANYLDIKGLLAATCKTVANMINGKTTEEIRKMFSIPNDFSPEEFMSTEFLDN